MKDKNPAAAPVVTNFTNPTLEVAYQVFKLRRALTQLNYDFNRQFDRIYERLPPLIPATQFDITVGSEPLPTKPAPKKA